MNIAFADMNRAAGLDAPNMPRVLGDPSDPDWSGQSERINANFALYNTWAKRVASTVNPIRETGTAVMTPAAGWSMGDIGFSGYRAMLAGNATWCFLRLHLRRTGANIVGTVTGDLGTDIQLGTLTAAYRQYLGAGQFYVRPYLQLRDSASPLLSMGGVAYLNPTTGVFTMAKWSMPNITFHTGGDVLLVGGYLAGGSG
jgi:hypothetical protein